MPIVSNDEQGFTTYRQPEPVDSPEVGKLQSFTAGFAMDNDVLNAAEYLSRPTFKPQEGFNVMSALKDFDGKNGTTFYDNYSSNFMGVQSEDEMRFIQQKISDENVQRSTAGANGVSGLVGSIVGQLVSPITFIPFVGEARGMKLAAQSALYAMTGAAAQEAVTYGTRETNQASDALFGIATSGLAAGILGAGLGALGGHAREDFIPGTILPGERSSVPTMADIEHGMVPTDGGRAIQESDFPDTDTAITANSYGLEGKQSTPLSTTSDAMMVPTAQPGGAAVSRPSAGGLARGARRAAKVVDSNAVTRNPVTYNIQQEVSPSIRWITQQFEDSGLSMEGNASGIATAEGGTISSRVQTYNNNFAHAVEDSQKSYSEYIYGDKVPAVAPHLRASMVGIMPSNGKLSRSAFMDEVGRALYSGDTHGNPYVQQAAQSYRKNVFNPVLEAAQREGAIPPELKDLMDKSYFHRMYNTPMIQRYTTEFVDLLANHFEGKYKEQFQGDYAKFAAQREKSLQTAADLNLSPDAVKALREQLKGEVETGEGRLSEFLGPNGESVRDVIGGLRSQAEELKANAETMPREIDAKTGQIIDHGRSMREKARELKAQAREFERQAGPQYKEAKQELGAKKSRLSRLARSRSVLLERQAQKVEKIDRMTELNLGGMNRAARAGQRALRDLDKVTDEVLDERVSSLKDMFARTDEQLTRTEARITAELEKDDGDLDKLFGMDNRREQLTGKLTSVAERLGHVDTMDRAAVRQLIDEGLQETLQRINSINTRRAQRIARTEAAFRKLDPEQVTERIRGLEEKMASREERLRESWQPRASSLDLTKGEIDVKLKSREDAEAVKDKIVGTTVRLPAMTIAQERGPELARMLDVPSEVMDKFLIHDVEAVSRAYLRTMAPDIEIMRTFGTLNFGDILKPAIDEINALKRQVDTDEKLSEAQRLKKIDAINKSFAIMKSNMEAVIGRTRHTWGMPNDPAALSYRAGHVLKNINVMRYMGKVTVNSVPDLGRPIMKYGLTSTFRHAFIPLVTNFRETTAAMHQFKFIGGGLDASVSSRGRQIYGLLDDTGRNSKFERGLDWATGKMGVIALFDHWTDAMKRLSGLIAMPKFISAIDKVVNGKPTARELEYLASGGIGPKEAQMLWENLSKEGGSDVVNGHRWANTEAFDPEARRTFEQFMIREVNNTIVTPGKDLPVWMDRDPLGSMLGQFKSFGMASTTRTVMAGLQKGDAALLNGVMISLGLGAMSYWAWAHLTGGKSLTTMQNASLGKWADEAIDRSGLLAVLADVRKIGLTIPAVAPAMGFSGTRASTRQGDNLVDALLGPSFGALKSVANVATTINQPTQRTIHQIRVLSPLQNTMGLSYGFDRAEDAMNNTFGIPKRRGQ